MSAAYYADPPLVRLLLELGADVHLTDASGGTALMSAALTLSLSKSAAAGEVVAILLRSGARWPFLAELPPGTNRGWVAQWSAMQKAVSDVQRRLDEPQPAGSMTSQGLMVQQRRLDKHAPASFSGADPLSRLDLDKPWMEHMFDGSAQERAREFLRQQNLLPAQGRPVKQGLSVGDLWSAQQRAQEVLQQQGKPRTTK